MRPTQSYERPAPIKDIERVGISPGTSGREKAAHAFFIYDNSDTKTEDTISDMTRSFAVDGVKIGKLCCSGYGNFSESRKRYLILESLRERVRSGEIGKDTIIFIPLHTHLKGENELRFSLGGGDKSLRIFTKEIYDCIWSMFPGDHKPSFHNLGCNSGYQAEDLQSADGYVLNYAGKSTIGAEEGLSQATEVLKFVSSRIKNGDAMPDPTEVWQYMEHYALQEMSITGRQSHAAHDPFKPLHNGGNGTARPAAAHQKPMMLIKYAFRHKPFDEVMGLIEAYDPQCISLQQMSESEKRRLLFGVLRTSVNWEIYDPDAGESEDILNFLGNRDAEQKFLFCKENGLLPAMNSRAACDKFFSYACDSGNTRIARHFMESPDFSPSAEAVEQALGDAIDARQSALAELLLQHTSGALLRDEDGNGIVQAACQRGDMNVLSFLVSEEYAGRVLNEHRKVLPPTATASQLRHNLLNYRNFHGQTALGIAIDNNLTAAVKLLLEAGTDPNVLDLNGDRVLHRAVARGNPDIVRLLLHYGANADTPNHHGNPPLNVAIWKSHNDVAKLLIEHYQSKNNLQSLNAKNRHGSPPLLLAIKKKNLGLINALLVAGANCAGRDESGHGLLYWFYKRFTQRKKTAEDSKAASTWQARWNDEQSKAALGLLVSGAPLDDIDPEGNTLLHAAARAGDISVINMLATDGADLNACNRQGYTALHYALENGLHNASRLLISEGMDLSSPAFDRAKALLLARAAKDMYAIQRLEQAS